MSNAPTAQVLCFHSYRYLDPGTQLNYYQSVGTYMYFPGATYSYPQWGTNRSGGYFEVKSANNNCHEYWDETFTGWTCLTAPTS